MNNNFWIDKMNNTVENKDKSFFLCDLVLYGDHYKRKQGDIIPSEIFLAVGFECINIFLPNLSSK